MKSLAHQFASSLLARLYKGDGSAGFTMIELLVVIAVIGVLAVAVLSSINPIEQINKGRDTRTRSDAAQLINAADRYYAIQEVYPWNEDDNSQPDEEFSYEPNGDFDWLDYLTETAEVKEGFTDRLETEDSLYIYKEDDSNATMYVCFIPRSQAFKLEAAKKCDNSLQSSPANNIPTGAFRACQTTDGETIDDDNMICLP